MNKERRMDNEIMDFIIDTFKPYSFERLVDSNKDCGFDENEYEKFIAHNRKCVNKLTMSDRVFVTTLIDKIKNKFILQCDEEIFNEWESYVIYFNIDNKLVIVHPR